MKKKADDVKHYGNFIVFDSPSKFSYTSWIWNKKLFLLDNEFTAQLPSVKDTIKEFQLEKCQLAFTIGTKTIVDQTPTYIVFSQTTTFSEEMTENIGRESDLVNTSSGLTTVRSAISKPSFCRMYKYAPRTGYTDANDEILICYRNKLKPDKYGG